MSDTITRDEAKEAVDLLKMYGSQKRASDFVKNRDGSMGISRSAFQNRLRRAEQMGLTGRTPVESPHGFEVTRISEQFDKDGNKRGQSVRYKQEREDEYEPVEGLEVKGRSVLVDPEGRVVQQWIKEGKEIPDPMAVAEKLKDFFSDFKGIARVIPAPDYIQQDIMTLVPLADWHLGLYVWGEETDKERWTLERAVNKLFHTYRNLMSMSPQSKECVILGGGDLLHADNYEGTTRKSKHSLDVSARWPEVLHAAGGLMTRIIELAAQRHEKVIVRILPGNHDEQSAIALSYFLSAYYRLDPRIEVDCDPSLFWWHQFGDVLLGATHGHTVKVTDMPSIMAHRKAQEWGKSKFRYVHGFHLHHASKYQTEGKGVISEVHQTPIPQDAYAWGSGYLSQRSMKTITYHRRTGEITRQQVSFRS